jgi:hypothetical protein
VETGREAEVVGAEPAEDRRLVALRELLAGGNAKAAFKQARRLHREAGTPRTEALVVEAAVARATDLLGRGLTHEARSVLDLIRRECPAPDAGRSFEIGALRALAGDPAELIAPLADAALSHERRRRIERAVERVVADPGALARCAALPADHALRRSAAAVMTALEEVTTRSAAREPAALAEVPRRGPMAGWKLLVRAIRFAHLGDAAGCDTCLGMLDPESAPGKLIPVLRALAHRTEPGQLPGPAADLWSKVHPNQEPLRQALDRLDDAFEGDSLQELKKAVGAALSRCRRIRPDLHDRLCQHISVLGVLNECPLPEMRKALRRPSVKDASFWRLFALAQERRGLTVNACAAWSRFALHAACEGWFAADSAEMAALYLHMADLLDHATARDLEALSREASRIGEWVAAFYDDQPKAIRAQGPRRGAPPDAYYLSPHELYRRATAIDPARENFARWLAWAARIAPHGAQAREAAEAWHEARPGDATPLLALMDAAEDRGALRKALGYLDAAEALDALSPQVRRARFRLWVLRAVRHLRDAKPHLVEKDLHHLDDLAGTCAADRLALIEAVRAVACLVDAQPEPAGRAAGEAARTIGAPAAAGLLIGAVAAAARLEKTARKRCAALAANDPTAPVARSVALACRVADEVGLAVHLPATIKRRLVRELDDPAPRVDREQALRLAGVAQHHDDDRLAYAAAGAGLRAGGATPLEPRLLVARGRSLPDNRVDRKTDVLAAAGALARRQHDETTAAEAYAEFRRFVGPFTDTREIWRDVMEDADAPAILEQERATTAYPKGPTGRGRRRKPWDDEPLLFDFEDFGNFEDFEDFEEPIPRRRAGRNQPPPPAPPREAPAPFGLPPAMRLDDLPDDVIAEAFGPDMPPAAGRLLIKAMIRHAGPDGELPHPDDLLERDPILALELMRILEDEGMPLPPSPERSRPSRGGKRRKRKRRR